MISSASAVATWRSVSRSDYRGEVLHVIAKVSAQVLDEPVEQRREMDRVTGGPLVVVAGRVGWGAVGQNVAVVT